MGFWQKLKQFFTGAGAQSAHLVDVAVRCKRCGEVIHGQIDLRNDLSVQYDGDEMYYFCRKGLVGTGENRCFQTIVVEYTFDHARNIVDRSIQGGTFLEQEA